MRNIYDNSEFFAAYAEMGRSKDGLKAAGEWHQLQPLFPKLQGKKVLDLGCGYGWHCKYAAQMGAAEILGIDSSQKMIAKAVADNSDDKIKYKVCGVEEYIYPENTYDLVVSNLVLHYIENLANVYQKVYCTLKVGGYFLFNIEHPTFTAGVNEDWIYDENGKPTDCCIGRGLAAIHSKNNHQSFVLYTMFSLKKQLDVFNGEGTVFGSINRNSLNEMPLLIPSSEKLDEFEALVAPMDAAIRNNYDEICRLEQLRDSLLPKLMSGELDVSDIDI